MEKIQLTTPSTIGEISYKEKLVNIVLETGNENVYISNEHKFIVTKEFLSNTSSLFCSCSRLESINMSNFDFSEIKTMAYWFGGCENLTEVIFPKFSNLNNLKSLRGCFSDTAIREIDLSFMQARHIAINFLGTFFKSKVERIILPKCTIKNFERCFAKCEHLTEIVASININLCIEDTLFATFKGCENLKVINFSEGNFNNKDFVNIVQDENNLNNLPDSCVIILP